MRMAMISAVSVALLLSSQAFGATINSVQGEVYFNSGQGYRPLVGTVEAKPGNSAFAAPGGSARVVYSDGCTMKISPGAVTSVSEKSPCQALGQANGGTEPNNTGAKIAIGAAIIGGTTAAILLLTKKNNDDATGPRPASP